MDKRRTAKKFVQQQTTHYKRMQVVRRRTSMELFIDHYCRVKKIRANKCERVFHDH